jgi:hypothetical protein
MSASRGFPASECGIRRLGVERRVLRLVERCPYQVPRILIASDSGFDVRQMVPANATRGVSFIAVKLMQVWRGGLAVPTNRCRSKRKIERWFTATSDYTIWPSIPGPIRLMASSIMTRWRMDANARNVLEVVVTPYGMPLD